MEIDIKQAREDFLNFVKEDTYIEEMFQDRYNYNKRNYGKGFLDMDSDFAEYLNEEVEHGVFLGATKICFAPEDSDYVFKMSFNDLGGDYGDYEYSIYQDIKSDENMPESLKELFVPVEQLMKYFGVTVYVQLSCEPFDESESYTSSMDCDDYHISDAFHDILEASYPNLVFEDLDDILDSYDINDLHDGNVGFLLANSQPVFFDYAGYHE